MGCIISNGLCGSCRIRFRFVVAIEQSGVVVIGIVPTVWEQDDEVALEIFVDGEDGAAIAVISAVIRCGEYGDELALAVSGLAGLGAQRVSATADGVRPGVARFEVDGPVTADISANRCRAFAVACAYACASLSVKTSKTTHSSSAARSGCAASHEVTVLTAHSAAAACG